jgi:hypothetical protein
LETYGADCVCELDSTVFQSLVVTCPFCTATPVLPALVIRTAAALILVPGATLIGVSGVYSMDASVAVDPSSV